MDRKLSGQLRLLHPVSDEEIARMVHQYRIEQIQLLFRFLLLFLFLLAAAGAGALLPRQPVVIERNGYGEGDKEESVYAGDNGEVTFQVGERIYGKKEQEEAFEEGFSWVRENMLGGNSSASDVRSDLNFATELPGGLSAEWISSNPDLVGDDGTVCNGEWKEGKKEMVSVSLLLSYGSEIRKQELHFTVKAPNLSEAEKRKSRIVDAIKKIESETRTHSSFELPVILEGTAIEKQKPSQRVAALCLLLAALLLLLLYRKQSGLKEQMEKRKQEILEDYPLIVNQLVLYLGAGMNLKAAFAKMASGYRCGLSQGRKKKRHAYEELEVMIHEMDAGVSERQAYENYGRRMGEGHYRKLMSLMIQNLQKGSFGLSKALSEEEESAFGQRLGQARKLGEEAGTKLLFPMILLLIAVMAVVMLPAVFQFQEY